MSSNLKRRFNEYIYDLNEKKYNKIIAKSNRYILKILKEYGINSFEFRVLEYVEADNELRTNLLSAEQYYIDIILPEYNILKRADSNKGQNLSLNTRIKVSKTILSQDSFKPYIKKTIKLNGQIHFLNIRNSKKVQTVFLSKLVDNLSKGLLYIFNIIKKAYTILNFYFTKFVNYITNKHILNNNNIIFLNKLTESNIKKNFNHINLISVSHKNKLKGKTVYVYLLNVNNEPKSLAFVFNSLSECSKFFKLNISKSSKLANNRNINNTFIYLNNKYILSYKIII
jgi:group I intron endonuclease